MVRDRTNSFGKEGFARITIDNLCGLLQITKGAFYHHLKHRRLCGCIDEVLVGSKHF